MLATANHRVNCVQILLKEGAEPHLKSNVILQFDTYFASQEARFPR